MPPEQAGGVPTCTCPLIRVGTKPPHPDGPRNLSPSCAVHGAEAKRQEDVLFGRKPRKPQRRTPDFEHHHNEDLACPACGTDSTVGCLR